MPQSSGTSEVTYARAVTCHKEYRPWLNPRLFNAEPMVELGLSLLFSAPWLIAIAWTWRRLPRDDYVPPSLGESVRKRLW
jgi:hypothetical protein